MNPFYVGLPAWVLCAFAASALSERGIGLLSAEQVGSVVLRQRADRARILVISGALLAVFLALRFGLPQKQNLWFLLLLLGVSLNIIYFGLRACGTIRTMLPPTPARLLVAARAIGALGGLVLAGAMAATVI
jgi:hypothetical protein